MAASPSRHLRIVGEEELPGGGNGGDNGGMEARVAKLEATVEHIGSDISDIRTDLRQIRGDMRTQFYWMLAAFAAVLGVMAKGFGWL
jgi:hypothetical protein